MSSLQCQESLVRVRAGFSSVMPWLLLLLVVFSTRAAHAQYAVVSYSSPANAISITGPNGSPWNKDYSGQPPDSHGGGSVSCNPPPGPMQAGVAGFGSVSCTGTITATITYTGDPALRPKCLIIKETSSASWSGKGGQAIDNLGGTAPNNADGGGATTTIKYSVKYNPAVSFTQACSPSANASAPKNDPDFMSAQAGVSYKVEVFPVTINLIGTTLDGVTYKVLTGQQVNPSLQTPFAVKKDANSKDMIEWTVTHPGLFKSYPFNDNNSLSCHVQYHVPDDWKVLSPGFFTKSEADGDVSCKATLTFPSGAVLAAPLPLVEVPAQAFSSKKPVVTRWDISHGAVQEIRDSQGKTQGFAYRAIGSNNTGEYWTNVRINVLAPFRGGLASFAQLITPNRTATRKLPQGSTDPPTYQKHYNGLPGLDAAFPYPIVAQSAYAWSVLDESPPAGDSPEQGIHPTPIDGGGDNWYHVVADDTMTTWVMYKPPAKDGQPVTYVPLMNYQWHWRGTMDRDEGGNWSFIVQVPHDTSESPVLQDKQATDTFPEWDRKHESPFYLYPP